MTSKLTTSKAHSPCLLCGDIRGDCRTNNAGLILCHTYLKKKDVEGFHFSGVSSNSVWGVWSQLSDDPQTRELWEARKQKAAEEQRLWEIRLQEGLTIAERDQELRKLSAHQGLTDSHRDLLRGRGLTDEAIAAGLFFSVKRRTPVPGNISARLPGIALDGNQKILNSFSSGFGCISFNHHGQATGWQIRKEDPDADNKYLWANGEQSSHLRNGELPLTSLGINRSPDVWLCEGFLKPFIASSKFGLPVIGAAGGIFWKSQLQLRTYLQGRRNIIFVPDAGDVINPKVLLRFKRNIDLFNWKYRLYVAWWGQTTKAAPDIDELNDLSGVKIIPLQDWISQQKITFD